MELGLELESNKRPKNESSLAGPSD
jgi:hypothetical protein